MHIFFSGFEAVVLALVLSLDAFVVSFAYGADKIKIPAVSVLIINVLCSFILGVSMLAGEFFKQLIPQWLEIAISFTILFLLGLVTLFDSVSVPVRFKHLCRSRQGRQRQVENHFAGRGGLAGRGAVIRRGGGGLWRGLRQHKPLGGGCLLAGYQRAGSCAWLVFWKQSGPENTL